MNRHAWMSFVTVPMLVAAIAAPSYAASGGQSTKKAEHTAKAPAKTAEAATELLDINSATKEQLVALPGVGEAYAQKIITGRPYKEKSELKSRKIVPESVYKQFSKLVIAKHAAK